MQGAFPFILNSKSYQDLKLKVKKAIPYQFATWGWWLKAFLIFGMAVFLEFEALVTGPSVPKAAILGVIMAMIGLCIQHDANHGAVSSNGWVNRLWGYTQVCDNRHVCISIVYERCEHRTGLGAVLSFGSTIMY